MADSAIGAVRAELAAIRDLLTQLVEQQAALLQALVDDGAQPEPLSDLEGHECGRERPKFEEL